MKYKLDLRPAAELDALEYAEYIAQESPTAAKRFLEAVDASFAKIVANPGLGHSREMINPSLISIRACSVTGFSNHLIFFKVTENEVRVLRIRHGAMDIDAIPMFDDE